MHDSEAVAFAQRLVERNERRSQLWVVHEIRQQIVQRVVTQLQTAKISKIVKDLAS